MRPITAGSVPDDAFLQSHASSGAYADCYTTEIPLRISQAQFIEAFIQRLSLRSSALYSGGVSRNLRPKKVTST